ncbi:MAG: response regulator [Desulfobacteraceae bacterium]|nr:MAG: response regulator [Desulfobacteraceae bacterium]
MIDIREMTVLIVDDMPNMINSIRGMLKILEFGREFFSANNGEEAWQVLKKQHIDMAIFDYDMPIMTGVELLRQVRDDRDLRDLPVVMVTAQAYRDFVAEVGESEVGAYILKPVTVKVLQDKVSLVVKNANNPPPMVYHSKRARDFEEQGNLDAAIAETLMAMQANPNATRPIREMGYYYFKKEDFKEAEKWLLQAAKLNALDVFAFHHLGELYLKLDDIPKASKYFEKAMSISPRHLTRGVNFGKTLVVIKRFKEAIKVFERTFQLSDTPWHLKEEIADFCLLNEADEYAAVLFEQLATQFPERSDYNLKLGMALEKTGDNKRAILFLNRADAIDKVNVDAKIRLAQNYLVLNKPVLAERSLREAIKVAPENQLAKELLKKCSLKW